MSVFVLEALYDYEPGDVVGVFACADDAEKAVIETSASKRPDYWMISEFYIGSTEPKSTTEIRIVMNEERRWVTEKA